MSLYLYNTFDILRLASIAKGRSRGSVLLYFDHRLHGNELKHPNAKEVDKQDTHLNPGSIGTIGDVTEIFHGGA